MKNLKEVREEKGLTQEALALASGLSAKSIENIEKGYSDPAWLHEKTTKSLSKALDISENEVMDAVFRSAGYEGAPRGSLRKLRLSHGLSILELSKKTGIRARLLYQIELNSATRERLAVSAKNLSLLANCFQKTVPEIVAAISQDTGLRGTPQMWEFVAAPESVQVRATVGTKALTFSDYSRLARQSIVLFIPDDWKEERKKEIEKLRHKDLTWIIARTEITAFGRVWWRKSVIAKYMKLTNSENRKQAEEEIRFLFSRLVPSSIDGGNKAP